MRRNPSSTLLLLNVAVLAVNFALSLGATDTQAKVLRTTARLGCGAPVVAVRAAPAPAPAPAPPLHPAAPDAPTARLVKFLARAEELDGLSPRQVEAVRQAAVGCRRALARSAAALRGAVDGARARRALGDVEARVRREVAAALRAARVPEGEVLARLVRIVMASAG